MEKEVILKEFNESPDLDQLIELAKSYYDSGEIISSEYLNWQYNLNPSGYPYFSLGFHEQKVIAQYIIIPINFKFNNLLFEGSLSLNTLTHPDFQGRGLFTKLASLTYNLCEKKGNLFTIGFPNPLSHGGFIKKLQFKEIGMSVLMVKPIRPISLMLEYLSKDKVKHGGDLPFNFSDTSKRNMEIRKLSIDDEILYSKFWNEYDTSKIMVDKDWKYLNWRYFNIPKRIYHPIILLKDGQIKCLCVLRIERVLNTRTAVIMDFLVANNAKQESNLFLNYIIKQLKKNKINLISGLLPSESRISSLFGKNLFFKVPNKFMPQQIPVIFRSHNDFEHKSEFENFNNWSLSFGDYDVF